MTAPSQRLERQLSRSSDHPRLTLSQACCVVVTAEEMSQAQATVHLAFSAKNLDNVERFSKSDPFLRVLRLREGGDWLPVLKTEVKDNNLDPVWQPIEVDIRQLCNADGARPLRIEVLDYENNGSHRLLGECQTSLDQLLTIAASPSPMVDLVNPKKSGRKGYQNSGVLVVRSATVKPRPSFLQYITGGCQLNFAVAIDFTGSNGDPRMPSSLHFLSPAPTMYEEAIKAVGGVLEHYDTDKLFPVWGFGAALPPSFTVSHCFAVGGSPGQPEVEGVQGILRAYRDTLPTLKLSGPTLFSPVITAAANMARQAAAGPGLGYIILLIITDGCIMDMDQTKEAIVEASGLPLSLLIVGVGDADFDAMEVLDGDKEPVSYKGRVAQRDIVQFVPLKATLREKGGMQAIAQELLAEIPGQVVGYFHGLRGILPRGGGPPSAPPMGGWH